MDSLILCQPSVNWNSLMNSYSHVLFALIIAGFICMSKVIHCYRCLCDPEVTLNLV